MKEFLKKVGEAILVVIFGAMLIVAVVLAEFNSYNTPILDIIIECIESANK